MRLRRTLSLFIMFMMILTSILSGVSVSSSNLCQSFETNSDLPESYLIEGVPYVGQPTRYCCSFASLTMIVKYYGINTTIYEILHNSGIGYSFSYKRLLFEREPMAGAFLCQFPLNTMSHLSLYGLKVDVKNYLSIFAQESNEISEENWEKYWLKIKKCMVNDTPIITSVDPLLIPYYREKLNITNKDAHGGHAIVIVGYNETNETVCYNDPGPGIWDEEENGKYIFMSKELFRSTVENTTGSKYIVGIIENDTTKQPLSKEERFNISHKRNIQRMKGYIGAYLGCSFPIPFPFFGIKALNKFQKDFQPGVTRRVMTVYAFSKMKRIQVERFFIFMTLEKQDISCYLLDNEELSSVCRQNGLLLKNESYCWENLTRLALQLNEIGKNNSLLKTLFLSRSSTREMSKILKEIISIHEEIISFSS